MKARIKRNMGLTVIVGLITIGGVAIFARNLQADTVLPLGDDSFTTGSGSQSAVSFPADFFGAGSLAINTTLNMVSAASPDTVVHRDSDVHVPGSTTLTLTTLELKSSSQLAVPFQNGSTQYWNVRASADPYRASTGSLTLNLGGTGTAGLSVNFILNCERNGVTVSKFDCPPIVFSPVGNNVTWWGNPVKFIVRHQAPNHAHPVQPPPPPPE
jgi:hypothetical protein